MKKLVIITSFLLAIMTYSCTMTDNLFGGENDISEQDPNIIDGIDYSKIIKTAEILDSNSYPKQRIEARLKELPEEYSQKIILSQNKREAELKKWKETVTDEELELIRQEKLLFTNYCYIDIHGGPIKIGISKEEALKKGFSEKAYEYIEKRCAHRFEPMKPGETKMSIIVFKDGEQAQIQTEWKY